MGRYWPGMGSNLRPDLKKLPRVVAIGRSATFVGGVESSGKVLGLTPSFNPQFADTGSLADTRGNGIPAFSRATTATVEDHEGIIRYAKAGEARFKGLRRVENLIVTSEDFGPNATWFTSAGGVALVPVLTKNYNITYNGKNYNATRFQATANGGVAAGDFSVLSSNTAGDTTKKRIFSMIMQSNDGNSYTLNFRIGGAGGGSSNVVVGPTPKRFYTVDAPDADATCWLAIRPALGTSPFCDILITAAQLEYPNGISTSDFPSEYVSVGVQAAPIYHGAAVDGVKYFPWVNGNTGSGNVVSEAFGATISSATRLGYRPEPQRTNLIQTSSDAESANWTKTDTVITANNIVGPDGISEGDLLTEGVAGTAAIAQGSGVFTANTVVVASAHLKRGNTDWIGFQVGAGADVFRGWFNLNTGIVGSTNVAGVGIISSITIVPFPNGWYRCILAGTVNAVSTNATLAMFSATGDLSTVRVNNATRYQWHAQFENAAVASSPIPTTVAVVSRNADYLTYRPTNLFYNNDAFTYYAEAVSDGFNPGILNYVMAISDGTGNERSYIVQVNATNLEHGSFETTAQFQSSFVLAAGVPFKTTMRVQKDNFIRCSNGVLGAFDNAGNMPVGVDRMGVGCFDLNNSSWAGTIKEVRGYPYALTDSMLQQLTT